MNAFTHSLKPATRQVSCRNILFSPELIAKMGAGGGKGSVLVLASHYIYSALLLILCSYHFHPGSAFSFSDPKARNALGVPQSTLPRGKAACHTLP